MGTYLWDFYPIFIIHTPFIYPNIKNSDIPIICGDTVHLKGNLPRDGSGYAVGSASSVEKG